ncbi:MAG: sialate O-acetylesterase [Limisphaerales bacterium]|jgi:sialate O-acetylesterase
MPVQILRTLLVALLLTALQLEAVTPASHFSDRMVLQRDTKVPVWGISKPGVTVTVSFAGQTVSGQADKSGKWRVELARLTASAKNRVMTLKGGGKTVTLNDVLVGEVWVGSGQSNMAGATGSYMKNDPTLAKLVAAAPYPAMRLLRGGPKPRWTAADEASITKFSAILFAFGERLHRELDVPVGLMVGAVGGTPSGAWMPIETYATSKRCEVEVAAFAKTWNRARAQKQYEARVAVWEKQAAAAKAAGKKVRGRKPQPVGEPGTNTRGGKIGGLFDRYIRFGAGTAIRGVLWDQGESGTGILGLGQYTSMSELIRGWRELWGQGDFPFLFVQKPSGEGNAWSKQDPITREADEFTALPDLKRIGTGQGRYLYTRLMLDNDNAWMVPACDLGPMVHPKNKWGYGNRSAEVALQQVYQKQDVQAYGPIYKTHQVAGSKVTVRFTEAAAGLATRHGDGLQGFAISDEQGKWHWAEAKITGKDTVVISTAAVKKPIHIRFAYSQNRRWANLFNKSGLPALAFTTEPVKYTGR